MRLAARSWMPLVLLLAAACEGVDRRDRPFPELKATSLDGDDLALANLHGKPWIINVWVPGCSICAREFPAFEAARRE